MNRFHAAIFDLDGTLLDSMGMWSGLDRAFLERRGLPHSQDYTDAVASMGFRVAAEYTIRRFGLSDTPEDLMQEWNGMVEEAYREEITLKPNARRYLQYLAGRGVRLGVATALEPELSEAVLKHNGVYGLFGAFASVGETGREKNFPDVYLLAAERLRVPPEKCVVFEDLPAGIRGAKAAGMTAVGVYDSAGERFEAEMRRLADRYILNFSEMMEGRSLSKRENIE